MKETHLSCLSAGIWPRALKLALAAASAVSLAACGKKEESATTTAEEKKPPSDVADPSSPPSEPDKSNGGKPSAQPKISPQAEKLLERMKEVRGGLPSLQTQLQARSAANGITLAVNRYAAEHEKATPWDAGGADCVIDTSAAHSSFVEALLAVTTSGPIGPTPVLNLPQAKDSGGKPIHGLVRSGESAAIVDPWGNPYHVILDGDKDGMVTPPAISPDKPPAALQRSAVVFSAGPDGNPDTWQDNIRTW